MIPFFRTVNSNARSTTHQLITLLSCYPFPQDCASSHVDARPLKRSDVSIEKPNSILLGRLVDDDEVQGPLSKTGYTRSPYSPCNGGNFGGRFSMGATVIACCMGKGTSRLFFEQVMIEPGARLLFPRQKEARFAKM